MTVNLRDKKFFLFLIFVCSLIVRYAFFFFFTQYETNAWIYVDSDQYNTIALNVLSGKGFSCDQTNVQYYRLPGYPLFLALCYSVFPNNWHAALVIQIILASFIPILIYFLSLALLPEYVSFARVAAIISMIYPGFVLYAGMLATETLTLIFLLLFFILFFSASRSSQLFLAGIFLGVASLIRPVGQYVIVVSCIMLFLCSRKKLSLSLFIGWLVVVSPWLVRNYLLTGALFFHSLPGLHFLQYTATHAVMHAEKISYPQARVHVLDDWNNVIKNQEQACLLVLNDYERCVIGERLAISYVFKYPWYACKYSVGELVKTCFGLYSAIILLADGASWPDYGRSVTIMKKIKRFLLPSLHRPWLVGFIYLEILLLVLMLIGVLLFCYNVIYNVQARCLFLSISPFIVLFILLTVAYGGARLRMPADPLLIIGSLYGWCLGLKRSWGKRAY